MKKLNLFIGFLIGFMIFSCSSDNNDDSQQLTIEELIVQGSSWTFNHYELVNIIDSGNSNYSVEQIENDTNQSNDGISLEFNINMTGTTVIPNGTNVNFNWEILNENIIRITIGSDDQQDYPFTITNNELMMEGQAETYDSQSSEYILHYGRFIYQ